MGHNWSGWPGACCLKCGVEHALENALGMDWVSIGENGEMTWKSPAHERVVNLCDGNCAADMSPEEFKKVQDECEKLMKEINEGK